jgi:hypothetical protein
VFIVPGFGNYLPSIAQVQLRNVGAPRPTDRRRRSADILDLALRFQGRKRVHNVDVLMSAIVAKRPVEHLERSGFTVMKGAPMAAALCSHADLEANRPKELETARSTGLFLDKTAPEAFRRLVGFGTG